MNLRKVMQLIGIGLVVYLSLQVATVQTIIIFSTPATKSQSQQDAISVYDARFSRIKEDLRSTKNAVGYLGCPNLDTESITYHYFLTQYALTPNDVQDSLELSLIVGNFPSELCDINSINLKQKHLSIIQEYGDGIFLLEQSEQ